MEPPKRFLKQEKTSQEAEVPKTGNVFQEPRRMFQKSDKAGWDGEKKVDSKCSYGVGSRSNFAWQPNMGVPPGGQSWDHFKDVQKKTMFNVGCTGKPEGSIQEHVSFSTSVKRPQFFSHGLLWPIQGTMSSCLGFREVLHFLQFSR